MKKRLLSLAMALIMCLSLFPTSALAVGSSAGQATPQTAAAQAESPKLTVFANGGTLLLISLEKNTNGMKEFWASFYASSLGDFRVDKVIVPISPVDQTCTGTCTLQKYIEKATGGENNDANWENVLDVPFQADGQKVSVELKPSVAATATYFRLKFTNVTGTANMGPIEVYGQEANKVSFQGAQYDFQLPANFSTMESSYQLPADDKLYSGKILTGWYESETKTTVEPGGTFTFDPNRKVYQFNPVFDDGAKLTLNPGEGATGDPIVKNVAKKTHVLPECPFDRTGYVFLGWTFPGNQKLFKAGDSITRAGTFHKEYTFTAKWEQAVYYDITVKASEDGVGGSGTATISHQLKNPRYEVKPFDQIQDLGLTAPAGLEFSGWKVLYPDGTITAPDDITGKFDLKSNCTITAQWKLPITDVVNPYQITSETTSLDGSDKWYVPPMQNGQPITIEQPVTANNVLDLYLCDGSNVAMRNGLTANSITLYQLPGTTPGTIHVSAESAEPALKATQLTENQNSKSTFNLKVENTAGTALRVFNLELPGCKLTATTGSNDASHYGIELTGNPLTINSGALTVSAPGTAIYYNNTTSQNPGTVVSLTGGTVNIDGKIGMCDEAKNNGAKIELSTGSYNQDMTPYVKPGYKMVQKNGRWEFLLPKEFTANPVTVPYGTYTEATRNEKHGFNGTEWSYLYKAQGEAASAYSETIPTDLGAYDVKVMYQDDTHYGEKETTLNIQQAALTGTVTFVGEPELGKAITASVTGSNATGLSYKWNREGDTSKVLSTDATYTPVAEDIGKTLTCVVTATDTTNYTGSITGTTKAVLKTSLTSIDVAVPAPVAGQAAETSINGTGYTGTISWEPAVSGNFLYNTKYTATVTLTPTENNRFTRDTQVTGLDNFQFVSENQITGSKAFTTEKAKITSVTATQQNKTLTSPAKTAQDVISGLDKTATLETQAGTKTVTVDWALANDGGAAYDGAAEATNTFRWTVQSSAWADYENNNNVPLTGTIVVTNPARADVANSVKTEKPTTTYNAADIDLTQYFTLDSNAGTPTYSVVAGGTGAGELVDGTKLHVTKCGTFTIQVETAATESHKAGAAISTTLTVNKASGSGTVTMEGWTFGETAKDPVVSSDTNPTVGVIYTYYKGESNLNANKPGDVGEYSVTATFPANDLYNAFTTEKVPFTIQGKVPVISVTGDPGKTYDGSAVTDPAVNKDGSTGAVSYVYYTNAECTNKTTNAAHGASSEGAAPMNAGTYWVKATVAANGNYNTATSAAKKFTIAQAQIDVSGWTWDYTAAFTFDNAEKKVTLSNTNTNFDKVNVSYTNASSTNAGKFTATATATAKDAKNYEISGTIPDCNWEISKAVISSVSVTISTPEPLGTPQSDCSGIGYTGVITWDGTMRDSKFGYHTVYTANVTLTPDGNHSFDEAAVNSTTLPDAKLNEDGTITGTKTFTATAKAKIQTVSNQPTAQTLNVYCESADKVIEKLPTTVTITADDGTTSLNLSWAVEGTYDSAIKKTNTFKWTADAGNLDANGQILTGTITVTNADALEAKVTFSNTTITYGETYTPNATADQTGGTITYAYAKGNQALDAEPTDVGTYTVTATFKSATHAGEATATLTINPKPVTITGLSVANKVYDGNTNATITGSAVIKGKVGEDNLTVKAGTASFSDANAGKGKTVTFQDYALEGTAKGNYELSAPPAAVTAEITAKPLTITGATLTARDYNPNNTNVEVTAVTFDGSDPRPSIGSGVTATAVLNENGAGTKPATVTVTLANSNYSLAANTIESTVTINQATYGDKTATGATKYGSTGKVDLTALLCDGAQIGSITKTGEETIITGIPTVAGKELSYTLTDTSSNAGQTATITIPVTSANYKDYTITVTITVNDKENQAALTITSLSGTYGQTVTLTTTGGSGTGAVSFAIVTEGSTGAGSIAGDQLTITKAGTIKIKATKVADNNYAAVESAITDVVIAKARPTGTPAFTKITASGKTLADAPITVGTITPAGTIKWNDADSTKVEANQSYGWTFTPTDKDNYESLTGTAVVYPYTAPTPNPGGGSSGGGGSSRPDPKPEPPKPPVTPEVPDTPNLDNVKPGETHTETKPDGTKVEASKDENGNTTVTETRPDGTKVESQESANGDKTVTETRKDGTTVKSEEKANGDKTITETKKDGSSVKSEEKANGDKAITETRKDGSSTKTEEKANGDKAVTETAKDGSSVKTEDRANGDEVVTKTDKNGASVSEGKKPDGTTAKSTTDANGKTEVKTEISKKAVEEAQKTNKPVEIPVAPVEATKNSKTAPVVKIELNTKAVDIKVSIPVEKPTAGTVAIIVHPDGTEEVVRKSALDETGLKVELENGATLKVVDNAKSFNDTKNHWAANAIDFATSRQLYAGTSATTFTPNGSMTRGMLAQVLYNLESNPETTAQGGFKDVSEDLWCNDAISWAADNGIVGGYTDGSFGTNDSITREQLAVMLYRYAGSPEHSGTALEFNDAGTVSGYAANAMAWAVENGIIAGTGNNTLSPQGTATRAQVATMLMRFVNK